MKKLFTLLFSILVFSQTQAQFLLNIDGESPNPFSDKSDHNTVSFVGLPLATDNAVEFPTGSDYLKINSFVDFELDEDWVVSFDIKVDSVMDSIYVIDWRSNSNTGHMHIGYNGNRGMYFSDRTINGIYGSLVADTAQLPSGTWVHFDVAREGDSLTIDRDGSQVASSFFVAPLSPLSTTTIGYSEDFRYDHASFLLDNITLTGTFVSSIREADAFSFEMYPNPVSETLHISTTETIERLSVYNILGELIRTQTFSNQLDVSDLNNGLYFLELQSENGVSIRRFIKN